MSVTINLNGVMPDFLRETMVDSNKTFSAGKTAVYTTVVFTAPRTITIPLASAVSAGRQIIIDDEIGGVTSTNTLTVTRAGSDTINGASTFILNKTYGVVRLISDGVSKWTTDPGFSFPYTPEDSANKSLNVNTDQASNIKYPSVKAVFDWASGIFQPILTAVTFGAFSSALTAKTTLVDADTTNISDSAAGGNSKKVTFLNIYNYIKSLFDTNAKASVSDLNAGTDDTKYSTSLGLEGSKYLTQKMGKITATASGTNTYTASVSPTISSYGGIGVYINFTNPNTVTNPTLALNGLTADGFVQADGSAIMVGALKGIVHIKHNGTAWQLIGRVVGTTTGSVASADDSRFIPYLVASNTGNAYSITPSPAITSYVAGQSYKILFTNANTGASTLNVNGLGTKSLVKLGSLALDGTEIIAGTVYDCTYDGTNMQIDVGLNKWYDWVPTFGGYSVQPTFTARYTLQGKTVMFNIRMTVGGTSNSTGKSFPLPVGTAKSDQFIISNVNVNNSAIAFGYGLVLNGSSTVNVTYNGATGGGFTSGVAVLMQFTGLVEIN